MIFGTYIRIKTFYRINLCRILLTVYVLLLTFSHAAFSQTQRDYEIVDSLRYIADTSSGRDKAAALCYLAGEIVLRGWPDSYDQYLLLVGEALEIAEAVNYEEGILNYRASIGRELAEAGYFRESILFAKDVISLTSGLRTRRDSHMMMAGYRIWSVAMRGLGDFDSALFLLNNALRLGGKTVGPADLASTYLDMARIFIASGEPPKAIDSYKKAYEVVINSRDSSLLKKRAKYARTLGYSYMTIGDYKMALSHFFEADSIYGTMKLEYPRLKIYSAQQPSNIARVYQHWGKLDSALIFRNIALQRFNEYGISESNMNVPNQYCYIGSIYRDQGDFVKAGEFFNRSIEKRMQIKDSLGVGMCLDEMAEMARLQGDYQRAVNMLKEALSWKSTFQDSKIDPIRQAQYIESLAETYLFLGKVFADWGKPVDAILYYDTSWMLCKNVHYTRGESIAEFFRGLAWQQKGELDSAMHYLNKSMNLALAMNNRHLKARALTGIAGLQMEMNELSAAVANYKTALSVYISDGFIREIPQVYLWLGQAYLKYGDRYRAGQALNEAYVRAEALGMIGIQAEAAYSLAKLYENSGNINQALLFLKNYTVFKDSVFKIETHRQLSEMQALHESQQQRMIITQLSQENELNIYRASRSKYVIISLGAIVIMILLFGVLFIRQVQLRNQQAAMLIQEQLFRVQMNPHFIFNSLTNIQHFIFEQDPLKAGKYLAVFAKLIRSILEHSRKDMITLREEIETITRYLELQQLRLENKLEFELKIDDSIDQDITEIPPMLAQPFIENAIEHGIMHKRTGIGKVTISIQEKERFLLLMIEDNGVGRKKAGELRTARLEKHESLAVGLTRTRLQGLWGRKKPNDVFSIIDLEDESGSPCGTLVCLRIPLNIQDGAE